MARPAQLRLLPTRVPPPPPAAAPDPPTPGDLALVGGLFALNLIPIVAELAGTGRFGAGTVGFASAAALLTGRELWSQLRAHLRRDR